MLPGRLPPFLCLLALLPACGDDVAVAVYELPEAGAPAPGSVPYPSDLWRTDAGLRLPATFLSSSADPERETLFIESLAEIDGYTTRSAVFFPIAGEIDDSSVSEPGAFVLVDTETGERLDVEGFYRPDQSTVGLALPFGRTLAPDRSYAAAVTDVIRTRYGVPLTPSATFRRLSSETFDHPASGQLRAAMQALANAGVDTGRVVSATLFTTARGDALLSRMMADIDAEPIAHFTSGSATAYVGADEMDGYMGVPAEHLAGWDLPADLERSPAQTTRSVAHDALAAVVDTAFDAPHYLSYERDAPGVFIIGDDGLPIEKRTDTLRVLCAIPRCGDGSTPCTSYAHIPLVFYQHGMNGYRSQILALADTLAHHGLATCGIDWPYHGSRQTDDDAFNHIRGGPGSDGVGESGDFKPTILFSAFESSDELMAFDLRAWRDANRQSVLDLARTIRLLVDGDISELRAATGIENLSFRPGDVAYIGESLGSIIGSIATSIDPRIGAAVFSVGGGGIISELTPNVPSFADLFLSVVQAQFAVERWEIDAVDSPARTHPVFQMIESVFESGDPLAYVANLAGKKHVVLLQAYGDELMPNQATEILASTAGLDFLDYADDLPGFRFVEARPKIAAPAGGNLDGFTGLVVQLDPACHGMLTRRQGERAIAPDYPPTVYLDEPELVINPTTEIQVRTAEFFRSYFAADRLSGTERAVPQFDNPRTATAPPEIQ